MSRDPQRPSDTGKVRRARVDVADVWGV